MTISWINGSKNNLLHYKDLKNSKLTKIHNYQDYKLQSHQQDYFHLQNQK